MIIELKLYKPGTVTSSMELKESKLLDWPKHLRIPTVNETIQVREGRGIVYRVEWKYTEKIVLDGPYQLPNIDVEISATIY
jgi:hypothetical protein